MSKQLVGGKPLKMLPPGVGAALTVDGRIKLQIEAGGHAYVFELTLATAKQIAGQLAEICAHVERREKGQALAQQIARELT